MGRRKLFSARYRSGLTRMEIVVLLALFVLSLAIIIPGVRIARWKMARPICSANIRSIIQDMYVYGTENQAGFPAVPPPVVAGVFPNGPENFAIKLQSPSDRAVIHRLFTRRAAAGSPLACLWLLVLEKYVKRKSFLCPGDPFAAAPSLLYARHGHYACFGVPVAGGGVSLDGVGESYSIAYPYCGRMLAGWWNIKNSDASTIPLASDMAPLQDPTAKGTFRRDCTVPLDTTSRQFLYNTGNHDGWGQNVGFCDDHVTWETNPYVGQKHDNIFTWASTAVPATRGGGETVRVSNGTAAGPRQLPYKPPYDTVMVPVRNVHTGAW